MWFNWSCPVTMRNLPLTSVLFNEDLVYDLCFCNSLECPAGIRPESDLFDASDVNTENFLVCGK